MPESDSEEGEVDANSNEKSSTNTGSGKEKILEVPPQFFKCVGQVPGKNASIYQCLFEGCKPKRKKNGEEKPLIVAHSTRHNAKRHFLQHDRDQKLNHAQKWENAILELKKKKSNNVICHQGSRLISQDEFNDWVLDCLIVDILPLHTVEKPGFKNLMKKCAPNLHLYGRTFFTNLLQIKFEHRKEQLMSALSKSSDAATTTDAWTSRRKAYLGETIHWFSSGSLKMKNACLAIRRIVGSHTFDVLGRLLIEIHEEFKVTDKLRGSTTDNGSNFCKCFREYGATASNADVWFDVSQEEDEEEHIIFIHLLEILNESTSSLLPIHRRCACHLLSLISKADVEKIPDVTFQRLRKCLFEKLQSLWHKQSSSSNNSDIIKRHLGKLLILKNDTRWSSEYYATKCIVRLLKTKEKPMKKMMEELKISPFTPNEVQYMKEYVQIMKSVVEALDVLQGDKNVGLGYLLPTISVLKSKLMSLQDDASISNCQPLITGLLDAIHSRFNNMFADNDLRLAAISNPMFRLSWLETDEERRRARILLEGEFGRLRGEPNHSEGDETSTDSSDESCSSRSESSPEKKRKRNKNFFESITKRNSKQRQKEYADEVDTYLKSCNTLDELEEYPTMKVMYRRYNVTLPSSAAVERLFSQGGLIFTPRRHHLTDTHFEMLLFLKINNPVFNDW